MAAAEQMLVHLYAVSALPLDVQNTFVIVTYGSQSARSATIKGSSRPAYSQTFTFRQDPTADTVAFELHEAMRFRSRLYARAHMGTAALRESSWNKTLLKLVPAQRTALPSEARARLQVGVRLLYVAPPPVSGEAPDRRSRPSQRARVRRITSSASASASAQPSDDRSEGEGGRTIVTRTRRDECALHGKAHRASGHVAARSRTQRVARRHSRDPMASAFATMSARRSLAGSFSRSRSRPRLQEALTLRNTAANAGRAGARGIGASSRSSSTRSASTRSDTGSRSRTSSRSRRTNDSSTGTSCADAGVAIVAPAARRRLALLRSR